MSSTPYERLTPEEITLVKKFFSHPEHIGPEFKNWLKKQWEANPPELSVTELIPGVANLKGVKVPADAEVEWRREPDGAVIANIRGHQTGGANRGMLSMFARPAASGGDAYVQMMALDESEAVKSWLEANYNDATGVSQVVAVAGSKSALLLQSDSRSDLSQGLEAWTTLADLGAQSNTGAVYGISLQARRDNDGLVYVVGRSVNVGSALAFPVAVGTLPWATTKEIHTASFGWDNTVGTWKPFMVRIPGGSTGLAAHSTDASDAAWGGAASSVLSFAFTYPSV